MREIRTWGSVRGVPSDWHPYRDLRRDATRAPTQRPECVGGAEPPSRHSGGKAINPGSARAEPSQVFKLLFMSQSVNAVLVRQLFGPHLSTCP